MSSPQSNKRILKELADAQSETMRKSGIYYWCNESDFKKGMAMILGPEGTPYAHCPLFFSLEMPDNYPFSPPRVLFLTSDGRTRFHPNLYVDGKVCLSILGTWSGPAWSAVMNLSTVLCSIQSLLEANPIVNEPGYEKLTLTPGTRAEAYAEVVRFRAVAHTLPRLVTWKQGGPLPIEWLPFRAVLEEVGDKLLAGCVGVVDKYKGVEPTSYLNVPYALNGRVAWGELAAYVDGLIGRPKPNWAA